MRRWRGRIAVAMAFALLLGSGARMPAQAPQIAPQQPAPVVAPNADPTNLRKPGDAYKEALHPLDVVRNSLDNWSDSELGALAAGIRKAKAACAEANLTFYSGDDVYDLARLCALGQDWNATNTAALKYIQGEDAPHRAHGYALSINALIHLKAVEEAEETAKRMMQRLPYDAAVEESVSYLTTYLEESFDPAALELATLHKPLLLAAMARGVPFAEEHGTGALSLGALDDAAMQVAFLERYAGSATEAAATIAEIKAALSKANIGVEDERVIAAIDTRFALLGAPLPTVEVYRSLQSATAKARLAHAPGSTMVLMLYPEWCTQCRAMTKPMTGLALRLGPSGVHAYGLLFQDAQSPDLTLATDSGAGSGATASKPARDDGFLTAHYKDIQGTPTLLVSATTPALFGATDYPLGVIVNKAGRVCFAGVLSANAFDANGYIEMILEQLCNDAPKR
jgi:hypothetical protein